MLKIQRKCCFVDFGPKQQERKCFLSTVIANFAELLNLMIFSGTIFKFWCQSNLLEHGKN